jgi:hypothetical protein
MQEKGEGSGDKVDKERNDNLAFRVGCNPFGSSHSAVTAVKRRIPVNMVPSQQQVPNAESAEMGASPAKCRGKTTGKLVGVGIVLLERNEGEPKARSRDEIASDSRGHYIAALAPGSPAGRAVNPGIATGDRLVAIDGMQVHHLDADGLRPYILGLPGSIVTLTFRPSGRTDQALKHVQLTRGSTDHAGQVVACDLDTMGQKMDELLNKYQPSLSHEPFSGQLNSEWLSQVH